jgi:hypothetical protein
MAAVTDVIWNIDQPISTALKADFYQPKPFTEAEWQEVLAPVGNFTLLYPIGPNLPPFYTHPKKEDILEVTYPSDGLPLTRRDLLESIYQFYQEELPDGGTRRYQHLGNTKMGSINHLDRRRYQLFLFK